MSMLPPASVIDASVAIKLFLVEAHMADVQAYFLRAGHGVDLYAPDLLLIECTNILWKQVQRNNYDHHQAEQDLADLLVLRALQWVPTATLLPRALALATTHSISVYDACYLSLAERLQIPLLTADNRLANQLTHTPHRVLTLNAIFPAPTTDAHAP